MCPSVTTIGDTDFESRILQSSASLVVVEFTDVIKLNPRGMENASSNMDRSVDALAASDGYPEVEFFRIPIALDKTQIPFAVTLNPASAARFDINHAPTTVFLKQGRQVGSQIVGYYLDDELTRSIKNARAG